MASTYVAGVFLTICTYEGPQLVYHYYDSSISSNYNDSDQSDGEIEWSDETLSDDEYSSHNDHHPIAPRYSGSSENTENSHPNSYSSPRNKFRGHLRHQSRSSMYSAKPIRPSLTPPLPTSVSTTSSSAVVDSSKISEAPIDIRAPQDGASVGQTTTPPSVPNSTLTNSITSNSGINNLRASNMDKNSDLDSMTSNSSPATNVKDHLAELPCGFDKDILAELLTPPESMCNEKFSVTVEDSLFIGIPVHILESGTWRPLRKEVNNYLTGNSEDLDKKKHQGEDDTLEQTQGSTKEHSGDDAGSGDIVDDASTDDNVNANDDSDSAFISQLVEEDAKDHISRNIVTDENSPMRMFHVSFVLNPPITEAMVCEERVYRYILAPFVRMLRQEQASKNYVWNEVVKMQRACESLGRLSASGKQEAMESVSELARALRQMCQAVRDMDIARILIRGKARAFQVPLQLELSQLPGWYDSVSPHSYVTTINLPSKEIGHNCYECYGLLLLDDPEVIVQEIEVNPQGPVAAMIRNIDPTSSLEELAAKNNIEIKQIVNLVWSLVYWRRARIIIPIHARYTYSVSPMSATGDRYFELARDFHELFPMMPAMSKLMALLSTGKPKPFSMHIPSTDHRHIYLRTISWLLQKDLVVHLQTFALLVVTRKVKVATMSTEEAIDSQEELTNSRTQHGRRDTDSNHNPNLNPEIPLTNVNDSSTEQLKRRKWMSRRKSSHLMDDVEDGIIEDPRNASPLEKRWISQIGVTGLSRNPELATLFQRIHKYFNGKDCLEQVMIHERITREEMRRFLHEFNQSIVTYKHW